MPPPPGKTLLEKADAVVETAKKPLYLVTMGFVYIGYIILFLGISYISPDYIRAVSNITYVMIGLVLMYKFNTNPIITYVILLTTFGQSAISRM